MILLPSSKYMRFYGLLFAVLSGLGLFSQLYFAFVKAISLDIVIGMSIFVAQLLVARHILRSKLSAVIGGLLLSVAWLIPPFRILAAVLSRGLYGPVLQSIAIVMIVLSLIALKEQLAKTGSSPRAGAFR